MSTEFFAFGEVLWDLLPSGRHVGGAPFNVTAHLAQLGATTSLISAVGRDALGDEILGVAAAKGVDTGHIGRARAGVPTGTVVVRLDANTNATYEIVEPVAWDEIHVTDEAIQAVQSGRALLYGSLAARSASNRERLLRLLALDGPLKMFDVNLRAPFSQLGLVVELAQHADVIKLNEDELLQLAASLPGGDGCNWPARRSDDDLAAACGLLSVACNVPRVCVTRGADGAMLWEQGQILTARAPSVVVRDTVGAGDAFMASLALGLTRGVSAQAVLDHACRLGAFVASCDGATPDLPRTLRPLK